MKVLRQDVLVKGIVKGNLVSVKRKQGECFQWKAESDNEPKETLAVSATMRTKRGQRNTIVLSCP